jgi:hypothetical protein
VVTLSPDALEAVARLRSSGRLKAGCAQCCAQAG